MKLNLLNPRGKRWPDFYGDRSSIRNRVESNPAVKELIDCGLLLTKELNTLLLGFLIKNRRIQELITAPTTINDKDWSEKDTTEVIKIYDEQTIGKSKDEGKKILTHLIDNHQKKIASEKRKKRKVEIKSISDDLEDELSNFRTLKNLNISTLIHTNLYYCPDCAEIFRKDTFYSGKCYCGKQLSRVSETNQDSIACISDDVEIFVKNNMWLEHGVERQFSINGYNTACGVNIMGSSGVSHEVDVLAESASKNKRIIGECKNREIDISDVFKLYGQMADTGCNIGFIFSTGVVQDPQKSRQVFRLASSKNIRIIDGILENTSERLNELILN
ncbi:MAG: restriction endonuclease [Candidatus Paceibacterota bacterium]|jgi:hypothetical protein